MRNVSEEFLKATKLPTRHVKAKATFEIIDEDIINKIEDIVCSSHTGHTKRKEICNRKRDVSFNGFIYDKDYIKLDGSFRALQDKGEAWSNNIELGWWSDNQSDENLNIDETITITFKELVTLPALGIVFDRENDGYATDFTITCINRMLDEVIMFEKECINDSSFYRLDNELEYIDKIVIRFKKLNKPFTRLKVVEVDLGIVEEWTDVDIIKCELVEEISYNNEVIPTTELSITVDNSNKRFNLLNPEGIYKYLHEKQKINFKFGIELELGNIEWVDMGNYYLYEPVIDEGAMTATFKCKDFFYVAEGINIKDFKGYAPVDFFSVSNRYLKYKNKTLYLSNPWGQLDSDGEIAVRCKKIQLNEAVKEMNIKKLIHSMSLISSTVWRSYDYNDKYLGIEVRDLTLEPLINYSIDLENSHSVPKVEQIEGITEVNITAHDRTGAGVINENINEYENLYFNDKNYTILEYGDELYYKPVLTVDGTKITENINNVWTVKEPYEGYYTPSRLYLKRRIGSGNITYKKSTLTAWKYNDNKSVFTRENKSVVNGKIVNADIDILQPEDSTCSRLAEYTLYHPKFKLISNWRQNPALECCDKILIEDGYNVFHEAIVTKQVLTYEGYLKGTTEAIIPSFFNN